MNEFRWFHKKKITVLRVKSNVKLTPIHFVHGTLKWKYLAVIYKAAGEQCLISPWIKSVNQSERLRTPQATRKKENQQLHSGLFSKWIIHHNYSWIKMTMNTAPSYNIPESYSILMPPHPTHHVSSSLRKLSLPLSLVPVMQLKCESPGEDDKLHWTHRRTQTWFSNYFVPSYIVCLYTLWSID